MKQLMETIMKNKLEEGDKSIKNQAIYEDIMLGGLYMG